MEYDRSLYRVYDRVIEDLSASPPVHGNLLGRRQPDDENDVMLPYFVPITVIEFVNRHIYPRFQYLAVPNQIPLIDRLNIFRNPYSAQISRNESNNSEQDIETLTGSSRNANPLYMHHSRRIRLRMDQQRRNILGNRNSNLSNRNTNRPGDDEIDENHNNADVETGARSNTNNSDSDYYNERSIGSTSSSDSSDSSNSTSSDDNSLGRRRNRREERMRRRQAQMDEPIEETLRRIRNRQFGRTVEADDNDDTNSSCTQNKLYSMMQFSMVLGILHLVVIYILHSTYVGAGVWKQGLFYDQEYEYNTNTKNSFLKKNSKPITCLEYALQTRPPSKRSHYGEATNEAYANFTQKQIEERRPLLGVDEILQIKIIYGGRCTGQCSRVHTVIPSNNDTNLTTDKISKIDGKYNTDATKSSEYYSSSEYWETPHYRYSSMEALMFLEDEFKLSHNLSLVNVTLTERCLSSGNDLEVPTTFHKIAEFLSQVYGQDTTIINQLMHGIRDLPSLPLPSDTKKDNENTKKPNLSSMRDSGRMQHRNGYLQNLDSTERWSWQKDTIDFFHSKNIISWLFYRICLIFISVLSFFLVTSITSVIVRVLTGSGVVLMFPLFSLFRQLGIPGANDRILSLSYPWIGRPHTAIQQGNFHPVSHLIWAHSAKILLYYLMYEACQAAWSSVLYGNCIPEAMPVWIFGMAMFWEYFSMVFVRSALSVFYFPRITLIYYTCFHIYFYSTPYGYFEVALIPFFFFMLHAMIYTILALEIPAYSRGVVSMECPREVFNKLSWSEWTGSLPLEWTLFLPLNSRYVPLHDRVIDNHEPNTDIELNEISNDGMVEEDEINDEHTDTPNYIDSQTLMDSFDIENVGSIRSRQGLYARRLGGSGSE